MRASLAVVATVAALVATGACREAEAPRPVAPPAPQTRGVITVPGLHGTVTVVRDEWGIPHITAATIEDLFFAQGFVQAQDRLFQMDLWKRAAQGRLAEVLGANFIQRDSMTRRIQFRGDYDKEWASYGPETKAIAAAFTEGVNAWVVQARRDVPEEFAVAGWLPDLWKPEDLLNRTDAFLASGNALDDLFRARMVAALGAARVDELLPLPRGARTVADFGVDLSAVTFVVSDALRRLGTPPFFTTLTNPVSEAPRHSLVAAGDGTSVAGTVPGRRERRPQPGRIGAGMAWAIDRGHSSTGAPLLAFAEFNRFETPARRYLVHLTAPGLDVIGLTSPWLPGVAMGHNERIAWSYVPSDDDTQDVFVERVNPDNAHQVARDGRWVDMAVDIERVSVLGRDKPVEYERLYTPNGVVIAQDRERHLVYTLRWAGTELGGAGELAALALLRASSPSDFTSALQHWKAPAAEFLYADVDGRVALQRAGLIPIRADGRGALPAAAWLSSRTWQGFEDASTQPARQSGSGGLLMLDNIPYAQKHVLQQRLSDAGSYTPLEVASIQSELTSPNARKLVSAIRDIGFMPEKSTAARALLIDWDTRMAGDVPAAALYWAWEGAVRQRLAARLVKPELVDEFAARLDPVSTLEGPASRGGGGDIGPWRDILLADALADAVSEVAGEADAPTALSAARADVTFAHPLGVFAIGQHRFNVGPYPLPGHTDAMQTTDGRRGATTRGVFDLSNWSQSLIINAPGQSGSPSSPRYDDLAPRWAAGVLINLVFDQKTAAQGKAEMLRLDPR